MTAQELMRRLATLPPEAEVMLRDGNGTPRELNLGPVPRIVTAADAADTADCEDIEGQTVYVLGFGCY